MSVIPLQLDDYTLSLLKQRLEFHGGNRAALAREIGVSRSGLSQAMDGKYPSDVRCLKVKIYDRLKDRFDCPHLGTAITPKECQSFRRRPIESCSGAREQVKHWQACQLCQHNPKRNVRAIMIDEAKDATQEEALS